MIEVYSVLNSYGRNVRTLLPRQLSDRRTQCCEHTQYHYSGINAMLCGGINSHTDRDPAGFNYIRGFPSCLRCLTARGDSWIFSLLCIIIFSKNFSPPSAAK